MKYQKRQRYPLKFILTTEYQAKQKINNLTKDNTLLINKVRSKKAYYDK
jgi:hypothetical protein